MSSKFNFSFRRREKKEFRNIVHGLIPAATIAPRPAVPRTPPPRSPNPSPERPRSALAAAILSSSLMGRTVAIPPPRQRSYSESDCSRADSQTGFEPYAATALYTRDTWPDSVTGRSPVPSPGHSDEDEGDDSDEVEADEDHVYQSLERQSRADDINVVYAVPLKHRKVQLCMCVWLGLCMECFALCMCVCIGESSELQSLRQQAQELVDENDGLKMTVHRLNVELSRYQARFRPLTKDELKGLPVKGPAPPWLLDMKYLSPLLLAYEDHLNAKDKLLKFCEEELQSLRARAEEVIQENEKLHTQVNKSSTVSNKEWRHLQEQARLVLEENQVLIEQLELQHAKSKEAHSKHTQEVCKVSKQLMLLESEKQALEKELEVERKEHHALKTEFQRIRLALEHSLSLAEHNAVTDKLKRQLQDHERLKNSEVEELLARVSALEAERKTLLLDKTNVNTDIKHMETEVQLSQQANRKAQRRISVLKQQVEDSLEKELIAHQYLANIVTLAERTTHERDQLMHMASSLEKDKQGILTRIIESTVSLGKLQEKVKVYKQQASASVCTLGRRLREQEEDFAGKAENYQREIRHLQSQLRDRQEQLHGALQQKSSLSPANVAPALHRTSGQNPARISRVEDHLSCSLPPPFTSRQCRLPHPLQRSPMFDSDSDQQQNLSSDESDKSGRES
uniref:Centrosomal protein 89 n=1 Tax=Sinocyclocheilus anshuiensis TaxID=1608454 RepID=A0A671M2M5_9TELE